MASVCIIMGSKSDEEKVAPCAEILKKLGIGFFMTVSSAHRTPEMDTRKREENCSPPVWSLFSSYLAQSPLRAGTVPVAV